jgi:hypothetical protein
MNDQQIWEVYTILHHNYTVAWTNMQIIREERNDGSTDWEDFHKVRLDHATLKVEELNALKLAFNDHFADSLRATTNKIMGV